MNKKMICLVFTFLLVNTLLCITILGTSTSKLYFAESDGKLYYEPQNTQNLDTFMNLENMSVGTTYRNTLEIHNGANREYELFLQILGDSDTSAKTQMFLSKLVMNIYYDGTKIFEGTADALSKSETSIDFKSSTSIGTYKKGDTHEMMVEITPDKDLWEASDTTIRYVSILGGSGTPQDPYVYGKEQSNKPEKGMYEARSYSKKEYESFLAKTTWKFYAKSNDVIIPIEPPNTGNKSIINIAVITLIVSVSIMIILVINKKTRNKRV